MKRQVDTDLFLLAQDEKTLFIPENSLGNLKEENKLSLVVCTKLFTNIVSWGQIYMLSKKKP